MKNDFVWTDELVKEFAYVFLGNDDNKIRNRSNLEAFKASKQPKPLFTTKDGHPLYMGDTVWVLELPSYNLVRCLKLDYYQHTNQLYFKYEEAAEQYILDNKPCLTFKEVSDTYFISKSPLYILKELVKSKITGS